MANLTPPEASKLYEELTGRTVNRRLWSRWAERGDVASEQVMVPQVVIPASEVERVAREGLPHRGKGGRPKKNQ